MILLYDLLMAGIQSKSSSTAITSLTPCKQGLTLKVMDTTTGEGWKHYLRYLQSEDIKCRHPNNLQETRCSQGGSSKCSNICKLGQSQGLLCKHRCHSLIYSFIVKGLRLHVFKVCQPNVMPPHQKNN